METINTVINDDFNFGILFSTNASVAKEEKEIANEVQ
jgi:hypothetical protein|tara:strand:- start:547 stop:657 length:111 start_codon:yes stop_codon:yes gene_type:complete